MSLDAELASLRTSVRGCSLAAFGDAGTRLMLRAAKEKDVRREYLDELCAQGANCLDLLKVAAQPDQAALTNDREIVVLTTGGTRVFVQSETDDTDFLCCVVDGPNDIETVIQSAQETLKKIIGGI